MRWADAAFHARQAFGKAVRLVVPKRRPEGDLVRLHLGCGAIDHPGFVNIDGIDRPHVHYVQSLVRLDRFPSNSIDFIYASHTLEHFPRKQIVGILMEWRRALAPGGRLCLSVPDFDQILAMYRINGADVDGILDPLFGGQDYPFNFHFTTFNRRSLSSACWAAGFGKVEEWKHGADHFHNLPDWSGRCIEVKGQAVKISLNLEATK